MKGGNSEVTRNQWTEMNQIRHEKNIDILAVQKTHLKDEKRENLDKLFERQLYILSSIDPDHTNAKGIAFVISKRNTRWQEARYTEIIPGRAIVLEIPWFEGDNLTCMNVYVPNGSLEEYFWSKLMT